MVKELEDAPRDEVAVCSTRTRRGRRRELRRAGARRRARSCSRTPGAAAAPCSSSTRRRRELQRVHSVEADWRRRSSCSRRPSRARGRPLAALLADEAARGGAGARARRRHGSAGAAAASSARRSARSRNRSVSLVWVDTASFAGPAARRASRSCSRLQAAGVAVAVVRRRRRPRRRARRHRSRGRTWLGRCSSVPSRPPLIASAGCGSRSATGSGPAALVVVLALVPALVPRLCRRARRGGCDRRPARGARIALRASARLRLLGGACSSASATAFRDFYDVTVPFDAAAHPRMHGVVLLAIFGFTLWRGAAPRPRAGRCLAARGLVVGAAGPATLLPGAATSSAARVLLAGALLCARLPAPRRRAGSQPRSRPGARDRRRRRRLQLARASPSARSSTGSTGTRNAARQAGRRQLRLGLELRRARVPEEADDRAPDQGPTRLALLARDDARPVRRRPLDRGLRRRSRAADVRASGDRSRSRSARRTAHWCRQT